MLAAEVASSWAAASRWLAGDLGRWPREPAAAKPHAAAKPARGGYQRCEAHGREMMRPWKAHVYACGR